MYSLTISKGEVKFEIYIDGLSDLYMMLKIFVTNGYTVTVKEDYKLPFEE